MLVPAVLALRVRSLLVVELQKKSKQPLIDICSALLAAEINIHYAYPLLVRPRAPSLALYVDDPTLLSGAIDNLDREENTIREDISNYKEQKEEIAHLLDNYNSIVVMLVIMNLDYNYFIIKYI